MAAFERLLFEQLAAGMSCSIAQNYDWLRHGRSAKRMLVDRFLALFAKFGWLRCTPARRTMILRQLEDLAPYWEDLAWLYGRLDDEPSRKTLVEVIAYRVLGHRHIRISRISERFWNSVPVVLGPMVERARVQRTALLDGWLDDFAFKHGDHLLKMRAHRLSVLNTFLLEQYRYQGTASIAARASDVIIDGGGCWGDTALYFATQVGSSGQVHSFEFSPSNLILLRENLAKNPALAARCQVHEFALWDQSEATLNFDESGPGTTLGAGKFSARTQSIDAWARTHGKVDFIKLDIEGAERYALSGAAETLSKQRPRLAVALYHSMQDFVQLPRLIDQLAPGYRFHLGHYTIHQEESILFASDGETLDETSERRQG